MAGEPGQTPNSSDKLDRRKFMGLAATAAGGIFMKPELVFGTAANSAVRVGLLGCGGRGTEDASSLVDTGGARVVALADLFQDQLDAARAHFDQAQQAKGYARLDASQLFLGPNAYQQIASSKTGRDRNCHATVFPPAAPSGGCHCREARLSRKTRGCRRTRRT